MSSVTYQIYRNGVLIGTSNTNSFRDTNLSPHTQYFYVIKAVDAANNISNASFVATISTLDAADTDPPTVPANLSVATINSSALLVTWNTSTDSGSGLAGYSVYRGGVLVANTTSNSFIDVDLTNETSYGYSILSFDNVGNLSTASNTVSGTTHDTTAPSAVTVSITTSNSSAIGLSWTNATDDVAVTKYRIFRDSVEIANTSSNTYLDSGLTLNVTYTYVVRAYDAANNQSANSNIASAATHDSDAPTIPTNVVATGINSTAVSITWTAPTDDVGVVGYQVYRDGIFVSNNLTTSFTDTSRTNNTSYVYRIKAYDIVPNFSSFSAPATGTTHDTNVPSTPGSLAVTTTNSTALGLTWNNSTDDVGVTGYIVTRDSLVSANVVSNNYTDTGLLPSTTYSYTVKAFDAANNQSAASVAASNTTANTPPATPTKVFNSANYSRLNTRYVSPTGNDAAAGTTLGTAWKTIQFALTTSPANTLIRVQPGTYSEGIAFQNKTDLTLAGDTTNPSLRPVINTGASYQTVYINNSTGIDVDNFQISNIDNGTNNWGSPIMIAGAGSMHHIAIRNCELLGSNSSVAGIHVYCADSTVTDYFTFEDNTIHAIPGNKLGWNNQFGPAGIWFTNPKKLDTNLGAHITVRRNFIYDVRQNHISDGFGATTITDGDGILLNSFTATAYDQRVDIYDNIIVAPGGMGIRIAGGSNPTFIYNNTIYQPGACYDRTSCDGSGTGAGIAVDTSNNVTAFNNSVYGRSGAANCKIISKIGTAAVTGDYNHGYLTTGTDASGAHDRTGDPLFASASLGSTNPADFIPGGGSPLIANGVASMSVSDIGGGTTGVTFGPIAQTAPVGATTFNPGSDSSVQTTINTGAAGTVYFFNDGVYRISVTPNSNMKFIGQSANAILKGSDVLSGWAHPNSSIWTVGGQTQQGTRLQTSQVGTAADGTTAQNAGFPDAVYFDGSPMIPRNSVAQVTLNSNYFYFDYNADIIYIGKDPTGHTVEATKRDAAFKNNGGLNSNVTIQNLTVTQYATPVQWAAIGGSAFSETDCKDWKVIHCTVSLNYYGGIKLGNNALMQYNKIDTNGGLGFGGSGANVQILNNEIVNNAFWSGINLGFEGGAGKVSKTSGYIFANNYSHDNAGFGAWTDIDNINGLYANNLFVHNKGGGISHEISYACTIRDNYFVNNDWEKGGWLWGAAIQIQNSQNVDVVNNRFDSTSSCGDAIAMIQQNRVGTGPAAFGAYWTINNHIISNIIVMSVPAGNGMVTQVGGAADANQASFFSNTGKNSWTNNVFECGNQTLGNTFWWNNSGAPLGAQMSFTSWKAIVNGGATNTLTGVSDSGATWITTWQNGQGSTRQSGTVNAAASDFYTNPQTTPPFIGGLRN